MVNAIGWDHFWDPNSINTYITQATSSPSTLYGRLRVYERFVQFLKIQIPTLVPSIDILGAIHAMLSNLKESLIKDRHISNKKYMANNRECMPRTFGVLKEWRSKRKIAFVKDLFSDVCNNLILLNENTFLQLRNFLIVEIILANAQRSGNITGMLIREVLKAESDKNSDKNHFI